MKNLNQGQEISKYRKNVIREMISEKGFEGLIGGIFLVISLLVYFLVLPILGFFGMVYLTMEYDSNLSLDKFQFFGICFFYLILVGFFWYQSYKKLTKNLSFNPTVVYYDDCLLVLHTPYDDGFKGEIPFKKIRRVVLLNKNIIQIITEENFFPQTNIFFKPEFYFQLHPNLRKISLQIVDELNSKVIKG